MKTVSLLIILSLLIISCSQQEKSEKTQRTVVTGKVSNFSAVSEHDFIEVIYEDILSGQVKLLENIDKKGQFKFVLDLDYPAEFYLKYSSLLTFHFSPGDSLHFEIDGDCWNKKTNSHSEEYGFYKISGTSERMNQDVAKYSAFFRDSLNNWRLRDSMIVNSAPNEYKNFVQELTKEQLEVITRFNKVNNTCREFREWITMELKYTEWEELMRYRWLHPLRNKMDESEFITQIPEDYFSFLNDWSKEDRKNLECRSYLRFIGEYSRYVIPLDTQKVCQALYQKDPGKVISKYVNIYAQAESGLVKDLLIAKFYSNMLNAKNYAQLKNIFNAQYIEDELLRTLVQQKYNYEKELYENPEFATGSKINQLKNENDFLQELIKKYPGKVIYLDFWAPWCSPCMGEMPHAKKMKKQFDGKDVAFVYLGNQCEEAAWKTTIAEKKIEGEHYFLTEKQFAHLSNIFGVTGIPHYALINKKGNIVNEKAPRPSSGDELINLINKHLN